MLQLKNKHLDVQILDPITEQHHFGVRYCTGGYIFQVNDAQHGALMTGPTYPESFNWFDGQGIPDAFNLSPLRMQDGKESEVEIIGVGRCDLDNTQVLDFCTWDVEQDDQSIKMTTQQQFADFDFCLERCVTLLGRTVRSHTTLSNQGKADIPMTWFPHPFFPQPESDELCRLSVPVTMSENEGFFVADNGFIHRNGQPKKEGFLQAVEQQEQSPVTITQNHPSLGLVRANCSYAPTSFPIWGNQNTFSWEPYLEQIIVPQKTLSWSIDYEF